MSGSKFEDRAGKIHARLDEGFSRKTLIAIIDMKWTEWGHDAKMRNYVRPDTLFGPQTIDRYASAADKWATSGRPLLNAEGRRRSELYAIAGTDECEEWRKAFVAEHNRLPTWREEQAWKTQHLSPEGAPSNP